MSESNAPVSAANNGNNAPSGISLSSNTIGNQLLLATMPEALAALKLHIPDPAQRFNVATVRSMIEFLQSRIAARKVQLDSSDPKLQQAISNLEIEVQLLQLALEWAISAHLNPASDAALDKK
jgi:hypothetical protein